MTIELPSHPGVILVNPEVRIVSTLDLPEQHLYVPAIVLSDGNNVAIHHTLPPQPYKDGTWTDANVQAAVTNYLNSISHE